MKLALVMLTAGQMSGGARKHFHVVTPQLLGDPRLDQVRIFLPQGSLADVPDDWPINFYSPDRAGRTVLGEHLADYAPDVIFVPTARYVGVVGARTLVMVRNMEPLETPFAGNRLLDRVKNVGRRLAARTACRRADRIIAVSGHVKDFLIRTWNIEKHRIGTVYHGVEPPPEPRRPQTAPDLGDKPFVFSAGSIRPARGLTDLIEALADPRLPPDLQLLFAGKVDLGAEHYAAKIERMIADKGLSGRAHFLGQLDAASMSWGFRNAAAFVMTSRAEACPNTVLEALGHGCLSVSGDNAPMPEFFDQAAVYYRNGDGSSLADALVRTLALPAEEKQALRARARDRAALYTWQACAERTVDEIVATARA
jgi:glycosyltransferase involved in cell wall biosynthesis